MKKQNLIALLSLLLLAANPVEARGGGQGRGSGQGQDPGRVVGQYPIYQLSAEQKEDLRFMWEEEKLARDVYIYFADKYGSRPFVNISKSEQKHMDAVGALLNKYNLEKPSGAYEHGAYANPELQNLYANLIAEGNVSEYEAFKVGEKIEIVDIEDLNDAVKDAHPDAAAIYSKLLEASYKHLNAFQRQL